MRIISQDKRFEIPYEDMCVEIGSRRNDVVEVVAYPVDGDISYCWTLGIYKTKERTLEVLEEIREHYDKIKYFELFRTRLSENDFVTYIFEMPLE